MLRRAGLAVLLVLLAACSKDGTDSAASRRRAAPEVTTTTAVELESVVAQAEVPSVPVFDEPGAPKPRLELSHPNE